MGGLYQAGELFFGAIILRPLKDRKIPLILFLFVLVPCLSSAQKPGTVTGIENPGPAATVLEGDVSLVEKDMTKMRSLAQGDYLSAGDYVRTGKNSRIEFRFSDGSRIRFDELTTFQLSSVDFDKKTRQRRIRIHLITGKGWFNVPGTIGCFEVLTRTARISGQGTIFRADVDDDKAVVVKVYRGRVNGTGFSGTGADSPVEKTVRYPEKIGSPTVSPSAGSGKNWTYSIGAMRQMVVHPEGTATKPFRFSAKADRNPWVRWNRRLDERL